MILREILRDRIKTLCVDWLSCNAPCRRCMRLANRSITSIDRAERIVRQIDRCCPNTVFIVAYTEDGDCIVLGDSQ